MAEEELETTNETITNDQPQPDVENMVKERIKTYSQKTKEAYSARDEALARAQAAEKERDFVLGFTEQVTKFPSASAFKDAIKEKVDAGYSMEDATITVLAREGKYTPPEPPQPPPAPAAGGSAPNQQLDVSPPSIADMQREEKRARLMEADRDGLLTEAIRSIGR